MGDGCIKTNKKGREESSAFSVIDVVLMVAITAAIAVAEYFYVSRMLDFGEKRN